MILRVHDWPPSKLTASNSPAAGCATLDTTTMFFGLVGLTATVVSDSLVGLWLISMLAGTAGCPDARAELTPPFGVRPPASIKATASTATTTNERTPISPPSPWSSRQPSLLGEVSARAKDTAEMPRANSDRASCGGVRNGRVAESAAASAARVGVARG